MGEGFYVGHSYVLFSKVRHPDHQNGATNAAPRVAVGGATLETESLVFISPRVQQQTEQCMRREAKFPATKPLVLDDACDGAWLQRLVDRVRDHVAQFVAVEASQDAPQQTAHSPT